MRSACSISFATPCCAPARARPRTMAEAVRIIELAADEEPTAVLEPVGPVRHEGAEHRYIIAFAVVLAAVMQVIDSSIVNVALPDMMGNLGASLDEIAWV